MRIKQKQIVVVLALLIIMLFTNCSTKKNTAITRTYHNITSYYNVYYNGNDAFKSGVKKVKEAHIDNYSLILPVFVYSDDEAVRSSYGDMNRAIEKAGKCIRKHSITKKPKKKEGKKKSKKAKEFYDQPEFVKWIDDSYLLLGKANFYKKDYYPAIESFNYIVQEYNNWPIKYEAYLWLARSYIEMEKYDQADQFLATLKSDRSKIDKSLYASIALTNAHYMLKQLNYEGAIPFLKEGIKHIKKKKERARYVYILAQLYQKNGQTKKAYETYGEIPSMNPPYEMVFNARINRASMFEGSQEDSKPLQKELNKMLKDDKNIDFRDQIYYALGNIAYNESRDKDALELYLISAQASTRNNNQKAISYLAVADMYFDKPDYINSQVYYDSAVSFLSNDYPDYNKLKLKSENLNLLVKNIVIIETQDSLQRIAALSEGERYKLIDKIIEDIIEQERREKEEEQERQKELMYTQQQSVENSRNTSGKWYFYNPSMLNMGLAEFKTKWGNRKLEDNWRRQNKQSLNFDAFASDDESSDSTKNIYSTKDREYYLVDIPLTDSAKQVSKLKTEEAYYNIAEIYKERFNDFDKSIESFLSLLKKYPETEFKLTTYYNLYKLYTLNKNYPKAEEYKQKILTEYPKSEYAKVLSNPNYFREIQKIDNQVKFMYQATYKYFINDNCDEVNHNYHYVETEFPQSKLLPKFALLSTLCVGHLGDSAVFKDSLNRFVARFPGTEEEAYAKEVLAALDRETREVILKEKEEEQFSGELTNMQLDSVDISIYNYQPQQTHYYITIVANEKASANKIKFNLLDFNLDYYDYLNFEVEDELLSADYSLVKVKKFKNRQMASNYYESVKIAGEVFKDIEDDGYREYIISQDNYKTFLEDKNLLRLQKFFQNFYKN